MKRLVALIAVLLALILVTYSNAQVRYPKTRDDSNGRGFAVDLEFVQDQDGRVFMFVLHDDGSIIATSSREEMLVTIDGMPQVIVTLP